MGKPLVVFGSFVVDLTGRSEGLPLPGQTIMGSVFKMGAGGKGSNQAVAAHRAGADVTLVTKLGGDVFANVALDFYKNEGMKTDYVYIDKSQETGVALILVDEVSAQNEIVVLPGACMHFTDEDIEKCRPLIEGAGLLLLQFEVNFDALFKVIDIAKNVGLPIVLNTAPAKPLPDEVLAKIDIVTPNETEAEAMTGVAVKNQADAERAARVFLGKGVKNVVITLGGMGVFATDGTKSELLPRIPVTAVDTTGAGDAFSGGFGMALTEGNDLFTALRYGNVTGALSVTKPGTAPSMPTRAEIDKLYRETYGA